MKSAELLSRLKKLQNPINVAGMKRFGIQGGHLYGISIPVLRKMAKEIGRDQMLAEQLWKSGIHEARLLAAFISEPALMTPQMMEVWVRDFDSWDICDQVCGNVFDRTPFAYAKAVEWCHREEEYVRRAGFALMATLAVHDKAAENTKFEQFFPLLEAYSYDNRNFVKKAVNWALRQIGKRNAVLRKKAMAVAKRLQAQDTPSARWIANDALRELAKHA